MKAINFSVIDILPSLLDKSKTQTIRPAGGYEKVIPNCEGYNIWYGKKPIKKPARFKVKEVVKLVWKQRSKYEFFDKQTGEAMGDGKYPYLPSSKLMFNKLLGTVELIEVFKIEMGLEKYENGVPSEYWIKKGRCKPYIDNSLYKILFKDLAKRDGFSSAEEMFNYFDKNYNLNIARPFWVYRWKWK